MSRGSLEGLNGLPATARLRTRVVRSAPRLGNPVGRPAGTFGLERTRQPRAEETGWSSGRGGPQLRSRAQLVVPVGVWDVSQRERPHPNKRLKQPSAPGLGLLARAPGWGAYSVGKSETQFAAGKRVAGSLSAER